MLIVDFLAPRSCAFCGTESNKNEGSICTACYADLPWNESPVSDAPGRLQCAIAMLHYAFPADAAIKAMKFDRKLFYAPAFAEILCAAAPLLPNEIDAILPVPLHWRRKAIRGFNQADEIARPVAALLGVPVLAGVYRHKATPFQSGLAATERASNLRQVFRARKRLSASHVLIVDDVVTTGATARSLAGTLFASGVPRVSSLAVARAGL
jgi:ComF family protein